MTTSQHNEKKKKKKYPHPSSKLAGTLTKVLAKKISDYFTHTFIYVLRNKINRFYIFTKISVIFIDS